MGKRSNLILEIPELSLFRGKPLFLTKDVFVKHPTLNDIEDIGEELYYQYCSCFCTTSLDVADILWFDNKIWYEDIESEWVFYIQKALAGGKEIKLSIKGTDIIEDAYVIGSLYRDSINFFLNLSYEYIIIEQEENGRIQNVLYGVDVIKNGDETTYELNSNSFKFTEYFYDMSRGFLTEINRLQRDYDFLHAPSKKFKKKLMKENMYKKRDKVKKTSITLASIVSSLVAKGVSSNDIWDFPIYRLYDIYYRLVHINEYNNTITALYNGCIDTKKNPVDWEKINWSAVIEH